MTKRQEALANINELACIGVQAIEAQKARRVWLDAKRINTALLRAWDDDDSGGYQPGYDPEIDDAYAARRRAAKESLKQARKLRSMVNRYQAGLKS